MHQLGLDILGSVVMFWYDCFYEPFLTIFYLPF